MMQVSDLVGWNTGQFVTFPEDEAERQDIFEPISNKASWMFVHPIIVNVLC
jgi:hypothetical protein